jgi:hypothetical protein
MELYKKTHNPTNRRENHSRRKSKTFTALIAIASSADKILVSIRLTVNHRVIESHVLLLTNSPFEQAWLAGYNAAQQMADRHAPGARLFVCEDYKKLVAISRRVACTKNKSVLPSMTR